MDYQIEERTYCVPNEVISILIFHSTNKTYEGIPPDGLYKTLSAEEAINYHKYVATHVIWLNHCKKNFTREVGIYLAATFLGADELSILRAIDKIELDCVYNKPLD